MEVSHVRHTRHNTNDHSIIIQGNTFKGFNLLNPIYHRGGGACLQIIWPKGIYLTIIGPILA